MKSRQQVHENEYCANSYKCVKKHLKDESESWISYEAFFFLFIDEKKEGFFVLHLAAAPSQFSSSNRLPGISCEKAMLLSNSRSLHTSCGGKASSSGFQCLSGLIKALTLSFKYIES